MPFLAAADGCGEDAASKQQGQGRSHAPPTTTGGSFDAGGLSGTCQGPSWRAGRCHACCTAGGWHWEQVRAWQRSASEPSVALRVALALAGCIRLDGNGMVCRDLRSDALGGRILPLLLLGGDELCCVQARRPWWGLWQVTAQPASRTQRSRACSRALVPHSPPPPRP